MASKSSTVAKNIHGIERQAGYRGEPLPVSDASQDETRTYLDDNGKVIYELNGLEVSKESYFARYKDVIAPRTPKSK